MRRRSRPERWVRREGTIRRERKKRRSESVLADPGGGGAGRAVRSPSIRPGNASNRAPSLSAGRRRGSFFFRSPGFFIPAPLLLLTAACAGQSAYRPVTPSRAAPVNQAPLSSADWEAIQKEVSSRVRDADFKEADRLLKEAQGRKMDRERAEEVRAFRSDLRKTSFLHHVPLQLNIWTPRPTCVLGKPVPIYFEIFNLSGQPLLIPSAGAFSWLPGAEKRESFILGVIRLMDIDPQEGTSCRGQWNVILEFDGSREIPPGSSLRILHTIDLPGPADTLYRRLEIEGRLIPGGLQTGPFDWGMIRLPFHGLTVHAVSESDLPLTTRPMAAFEEGIAALDIRRILLGAFLAKEEDRWRTVDSLIRVLPALSQGAGHAVMEALAWLTGIHQGYDMNRWIDWWDLHRDGAPGPSFEGAAGFRVEGGMSLLGKDTGPVSKGAGSRTGWGRGGLIPLNPVALGLFAAAFPTDKGKPLPRGEDSAPSVTMEKMKTALDDPYYGRRYGMVKKLQDMGGKGIPALRVLVEDASPRVRRGAAEALEGIESDRVEEILLHAFAKEGRPGVRQKMVQVLALRAGRDSKGMPDGLGEELDKDPILETLYDETAMMAGLENVLHFNAIPGFFDGQFHALWSLTPRAYERLSHMALDEDLSFQIRTMAIMALQERKNPRMVALLKPLVLDPKMELDMEYEEFMGFRMNESVVLDHRRRNLSKYARFSMAKAGFTRFNLEKIRVMEDFLKNNGRAIYRRKPGLGRMELEPLARMRRFGKSLILDIGYNYQQFDRFDQAEYWYLHLLSSFPGEEDAAMQAEACYNLACLYALTSRKEGAFKYLEQAVNKGFTDFAWMERDRDLDSLRQDPGYEAVRRMIMDRPAREAIKDNKE